jgi:hypothetical protein
MIREKDLLTQDHNNEIAFPQDWMQKRAPDPGLQSAAKISVRPPEF